MDSNRKQTVWRKSLPWLLAAAALVTGLAATSQLAQRSHDHQQALRQTLFQAESDRIATTIANRLDAYVSVMRDARGYFEGSDAVSLSDFKAFVATLDLPSMLTGMQGIAYSASVPREQVTTFIAEARRQVGPNYRIKSKGHRDYLAVIKYIRPLDRANQRALLCLNLDRFKIINDSLGHETGDQVLQKIASRILGEIDRGTTFGRFGADEYFLLLAGSTAGGAKMVAQQLLTAIAATITRATTSVGP